MPSDTIRPSRSFAEPHGGQKQQQHQLPNAVFSIPNGCFFHPINGDVVRYQTIPAIGLHKVVTDPAIDQVTGGMDKIVSG